ncbi:hypothetical protein NP493_669g01048 [Ridgeia piscesae]|uniref:Uncharacterized protein n=1 Tax=Ridgeia piscesae TaxID=27915 RepID=A0AAD9KRN3_RIDPI|nr:hypothetical protein NP493_669g01048 [Ridgeia piscesae]
MACVVSKVDSHQFWQYRWVELMDGTSPRPLRVELYATSQFSCGSMNEHLATTTGGYLNEQSYHINGINCTMADNFPEKCFERTGQSEIKPQTHKVVVPNTILVCTQMRLVHNLNDITSSHQQRALHVTTTNESQLCVHADEIADRYHSPVVKQLLQWSASPQGQRTVKAAQCVGGYYSYPPLSTSLRGHQGSFTGEAPLTLVTGDRLTTELSSLCCHEHRRVTIQGFLVHIQFVAPVLSKQRALPKQDGYSLRSKKQTQEQRKNSGRKRKSECLDNDAPNMETVQLTSVLVDKAWPPSRGDVETLGSTVAPPSFFQRDYFRKNESAVRSCLCMPSSSYKRSSPKTKLEDLPKHASPGHFVVTIVSLNHQMVLHTLFPLPDQISHNATMAGLLSGLVSEECTKAETYDPSPTNISNLLDTAKHCHDRRMLFVLDLFRYRGDAVEIVLNRAFVVR